MYPYLKELTLDEALKLPPDAIVYSPSCPNKEYRLDKVNVFNLELTYSRKWKLYCTALDYATHILNQAAPPEGWGYAAYELSSGRYDSLHYHYFQHSGGGDIWDTHRTLFRPFTKSDGDKTVWHYWSFRLTDLARVEGTDTDKKPINVEQVVWLSQNGYDFKIRVWGAENEIQGACFNHTMLKWAQEGTTKILAWQYDKLPDEFKALAAPIPPPATSCPKCYEVMTELKQQIADLEAKNKELKNEKLICDTYIEAFEEADGLRQILKKLDSELNEARNNYRLIERPFYPITLTN
jgi:hypothetical protein